MNRHAAAKLVLQSGEDAGFALCGIAPASPSAHAAHVREWIASGKHGQMHYLEEHLDLRLDPQVMMPGCRSVVVVAMFYGPPPEQEQEQEPASKTPASNAPSDNFRGRGRLAKYAADFPGGDYHKVMKRRLHAMADQLAERLPGERFRACVDTAPVMEREHAAAAGLGWIGKHTLLIHPRLGSWMMLGCLLTTADLATSEQLDFPGDLIPGADHCGTCTRCIDACPTDAITPYAVDGSRCISYLTIEHRSPIAPELEAKMGDWIGGCDICQDVCPHPRQKQPVDIPAADKPPHGQRLDLLEVLDWSAEDRQAALRGSALKRIKLDMWKRNALIALGNLGLAPLARQRIETLAADEAQTQIVRTTAKQVLARDNQA